MELNRATIKKILGMIVFAVVIFVGCQNLSSLFSAVTFVLRLLTPVIVGFCLAFILNVPLKLFEEKVFAFLNKRSSKIWPKIRRPICLVLSFSVFLGVIFFLLFLLIPEISKTITTLASNLPSYFATLEQWIERLNTDLTGSASLGFLQLDWDKLSETVVQWLNQYTASMLDSTVQLTTSIISGIVNFVLSVCFSIYMLMRKEQLSDQWQRLLFAFCPQEKADRILSIGRLTTRTFTRFITGQLTEAVILGTLCMIGMSILRLPYASAISMLVCVMALVPIFGAFIGAAVGAFLILMVDPLQALWFLVFLIILQQIEGNLIYPKVVGTSIGLPGIWVLLAVTVGGGLLGIAGMLISVPLCSVIYCLLQDVVRRRIRERRIVIPRPAESRDFSDDPLSQSSAEKEKVLRPNKKQ